MKWCVKWDDNTWINSSDYYTHTHTRKNKLSVQSDSPDPEISHQHLKLINQRVIIIPVWDGFVSSPSYYKMRKKYLTKET